jgi:translation initiation factor IF-2
MAKIRIYELARDLNMQNKALLEKLKDMNISVRSHMSSLDDETVAKIKAHILGKPADAVEVTRVRPTVIRRRRKRVEEEPVTVEAVPELEVRPAAAEVAETPSEEAPEEEPLKVVPPEKAVEETEAAETDAIAQAPLEEEAAAERAVEAVEVAEPVQIVEPVEPAASAETVEAETVEPVETVEIVEPVEAAEPSVPVEAEEPAPAVEPVPAVTKPEKAPAVKKKKKGKREMPAKIIKLPVAPPEEKPKEVPEVQVTRPSPRREEPVAPRREASLREIGRKKKGVEEPAADRKFLKKKSSFRRKEVVEGASLYTKGPRGRRNRKGAKGKAVRGLKPQITVPKAIKRRVKVDEAIVLSELAKRMGIKAGEMIQKLMTLGVMVTVNQTIDFDTAALVAAEFEYEVEKASFEEEAVLKAEKDEPGTLAERPPVVTIMGHVDHGKTSLLDVIRKTRVTEFEAGGITQHIGAYNVSTDNGQIVFLDTPGHEAFTAMRARGAKVTDIVILVVAADDGVMPQTVEAINHAKASEVPIIVAINKIDKANADPERVQRELAELGLVPEDWGGDTILVKVSAKQNQGISELLEMILLQAELLELKANPEKLAKGHVVEAKLDSGRGAVATVLVQEGTLRSGDPVVCGVHYGKVRAMLNDRGVPVEVAGPSMPVEVIGLSGVPMAGDELIALADEKDARQVSMHRTQKQRSKDLAKTSRMSLEKLFERMQEGEVKELNLIIKADVDGSIEALRDSLVKLSNEEVKINIIHSATGTITESDISLAAVSDAIIVGFNVRPNAKVQDMADEEHVDIRYHNIIYNVIKEVKDAIVGMMASTFEERILGRATVREVFHVPKVGAIAGCYVTDGKIERGQLIRLLRDGVIRYEGKIASLRRYKDDVKEVQSGYECGIGIENYNDIKIGDSLDCYYMEEIRPELE